MFVERGNWWESQMNKIERIKAEIEENMKKLEEAISTAIDKWTHYKGWLKIPILSFFLY